MNWEQEWVRFCVGQVVGSSVVLLVWIWRLELEIRRATRDRRQS